MKGEDFMGKFRLHDLEHDTVLDLELTAEQFVELKRFLKDLKTPRENVDCKKIIELYNSVCKNLPPATRLTDKRKRAVSRLIKDGYDLDELFRKAAQSSFLGAATRGSGTRRLTGCLSRRTRSRCSRATTRRSRRPLKIISRRLIWTIPERGLRTGIKGRGDQNQILQI